MKPAEKIENILVLIEPAGDYEKEFQKQFPESRLLFTSPGRVTEEEIGKADVILGNPPAGLLKGAERLSFLQLQSAGADAYTPKGILPEKTLLACASGAYGPAVSEHMMASLLSVYKNLHLYRDNQAARLWKCEGAVRSLRGEQVLVLGLGDIGKEFARLAVAFGASVFGVKRNLSEKPDFVREVYPMEKLPQILPRFDVVACALPSSPETSGLFDRDMLRRMKAGSVLIKMRGAGALSIHRLFWKPCRKALLWLPAWTLQIRNPFLPNILSGDAGTCSSHPIRRAGSCWRKPFIGCGRSFWKTFPYMLRGKKSETGFFMDNVGEISYFHFGGPLIYAYWNENRQAACAQGQPERGTGAQSFLGRIPPRHSHWAGIFFR